MTSEIEQSQVTPEAQVRRSDQVWTFGEIANRAQSVRDLIARHRLQLHRESTLAKLLRDANKLATDWQEGRTERSGVRQLVNAAHANRISEALLSIQDDSNFRTYLKRIAGNPIDLSDRNQSQGKDALWEVDLLNFMSRRGVVLRLCDPPDLMATLHFGEYPIACKKIYSERGLDAQMRKGVSQLARCGQGGLVAINIDDLVPKDVILKTRSLENAEEFLASNNHEFIDRNQACLQRYVMNGKCDGVIVSTTVLADMELSSPRFNTYTQATFWTLTRGNSIARERFNKLRDLMASA